MKLLGFCPGQCYNPEMRLRYSPFIWKHRERSVKVKRMENFFQLFEGNSTKYTAVAYEEMLNKREQ